MGLKEKQDKMKERWSILRRHPITKRLVPEDVSEAQEIEILCNRTDLKCPSCKTAPVMASKATGEVPLCSDCKLKTVQLRKHKITLRQFRNMVVKQQGKCAICLRQEGDNLFVDHCHDVGHVRGLLCRGCNTALGYVGDDEDILSNAIKYLKFNRLRGGWCASALGK